MENENKTLALDIEKYEKYVADLAHWNNENEANRHALAEDLQKRGSHDASL